MTGQRYSVFIPNTDSGTEAVVSSGYVMLERADVVGTNLVRNQVRVSVETLVGTLFPDDKLSSMREMDGLVPQVNATGHQDRMSH